MAAASGGESECKPGLQESSCTGVATLNPELRHRLVVIEGKLDRLAQQLAPKVPISTWDVPSMDLMPAVPEDGAEQSQAKATVSGLSCLSGQTSDTNPEISSTSPTFSMPLPGTLPPEGVPAPLNAGTPSQDVAQHVDNEEDEEGVAEILAKDAQKASIVRPRIKRMDSGDSEDNWEDKVEDFAIEKLGWGRLQRHVKAQQDIVDSKPPHVIHGPRFQLLVSSVILFNAITVGVRAQNQLRFSDKELMEASVLDGLEWFIFVFFMFELLARIWVDRVLFLFGKEWKWNLFDSFLMIVGTLQGILGVANSRGMFLARFSRMARFFRLLRLTRVMRNLYSLRLVVFAIIDSMVSLLWCFIVMFIIVYAFAVLIMLNMIEFYGSDADSEEPMAIALAVKDEVKGMYGNIPTAMITLFKAISGGADWQDLLSPLEGLHWSFTCIFVCYIFFMYIGVLNVVIGAFVATTQDLAQRDKEALVKTERSRIQTYTSHVKQFFQTADTNKDGRLTWEEFEKHLNCKEVQAYFNAMELDVTRAQILFELLDKDGSNQITVDEFLDGCIRLKGQARSIDLNLMLFSQQSAFERINGFIGRVDARLVKMTRQARPSKPAGMILTQSMPQSRSSSSLASNAKESLR